MLVQRGYLKSARMILMIKYVRLMWKLTKNSDAKALPPKVSDVLVLGWGPNQDAFW